MHIYLQLKIIHKLGQKFKKKLFKFNLKNKVNNFMKILILWFKNILIILIVYKTILKLIKKIFSLLILFNKISKLINI